MEGISFILQLLLGKAQSNYHFNKNIKDLSIVVVPKYNGFVDIKRQHTCLIVDLPGGLCDSEGC